MTTTTKARDDDSAALDYDEQSAPPRLVTKKSNTNTTLSTTAAATSPHLLNDWLQHSSLEFHSLDKATASAIRTALLEWYQQHRRRLPWRGDAPPWTGSTANFAQKRTAKNKNDSKKQKQMTDFFQAKKNGTTKASSKQQQDDDDEEPSTESAAFPVTAYGVWVSEIMLQQTRVEAVVPYWVAWMKAFPTVADLAAATPEQVNAHWAGLGFYRRARLLHSAAQYCVQHYNNNNDGQVPCTVDELLKLPGIGRYTASAIASIAYNVTVPVVDGNVCRVLSRLLAISQNVKAPVFKDVYAWDLAAAIVEAGDGQQAGLVNQALMELGATYCAPAGTGVDPGDPLKDFYWSTRLGRQAAAARQEHGPNHLHQLSVEAQERAAAATAACSSSNKKKKKGSKSKPSTEEEEEGSFCPLCGTDGVAVALENLIMALDEAESNGKQPALSLDEQTAAKCGHSVFPLAPPKAAKREEVLAVAAISCQLQHQDDEDDSTDPAWLLVRRPESGLLAGQWEFPSFCVWNSDEESKKSANGQKKTSKRKDMSNSVPVIAANVRRQALDGLLNQLLLDAQGEHVNTMAAAAANDISRSQLNIDPIEHVFSHVRHTMWIEAASVHVDSLDLQGWQDASGRQVRWMRASEMQKVGITSGVKKILKTVKKHHEPTSKSPGAAAKKSKATKRAKRK